MAQRSSCRAAVASLPAYTGQAATEFALVFPFVLTLIFGIIQMGIVLVEQASFTFAVEQAAHMAAIKTTQASADSATCSALLKASGILSQSNFGPTTVFDATAISAGSTDNGSAHDVGICLSNDAFQGSVATWPPSSRNQNFTPDVLGITSSYTYTMILPWPIPQITFQKTALVRSEDLSAFGGS